jgi:hypothetical protein
MMSDDIADALDLVPMQPEQATLTPINQVIKVEMVKGNTEFDTAKGGIENVIKIGTEAMNDLIDLAKLSQDPRSYRVLTELLGAMTSANKELAEIKAREVEVRLKEDKGDKPDTVNNNLLVTTPELLEMLKRKGITSDS